MAINPLMFVRGESPRTQGGWTPPTPPEPEAPVSGKDFIYHWQRRRKDERRRKNTR